jgi:hypothetical protein
MMRKGADVVQLAVLSHNVLGGTEEKHNKLQLGQQVSRPKFQPNTCWAGSRSANHWTVMFGENCKSYEKAKFIDA